MWGMVLKGIVNGGCAFVTMFTQIFKDNPTISKGLLCNFSSYFIVAAVKKKKYIYM